MRLQSRKPSNYVMLSPRIGCWYMRVTGLVRWMVRCRDMTDSVRVGLRLSALYTQYLPPYFVHIDHHPRDNQSAEASNGVVAPLSEARSFGKQPITNDKGHIFYIVDLTDDAQEAFSDERSAPGRQRFHERHSGKAQNMVEAYEKYYGFEYVDMTSWVGNSFSAYLNKAQVENLRVDPRVLLISEVVEATFSATSPPWYPPVSD